MGDMADAQSTDYVSDDQYEAECLSEVEQLRRENDRLREVVLGLLTRFEPQRPGEPLYLTEFDGRPPEGQRWWYVSVETMDAIEAAYEALGEPVEE